MRIMVDDAGRLTIPQPLRGHLGVLPGEVEVVADGTGIHIEPIVATELDEEAGGVMLIGSNHTPIDDEVVRALRLAGQR